MSAVILITQDGGYVSTHAYHSDSLVATTELWDKFFVSIPPWWRRKSVAYTVEYDLEQECYSYISVTTSLPGNVC